MLSVQGLVAAGVWVVVDVLAEAVAWALAVLEAVDAGVVVVVELVAEGVLVGVGELRGGLLACPLVPVSGGDGNCVCVVEEAAGAADCADCNPKGGLAVPPDLRHAIRGSDE